MLLLLAPRGVTSILIWPISSRVNYSLTYWKATTSHCRYLTMYLCSGSSMTLEIWWKGSPRLSNNGIISRRPLSKYRNFGRRNCGEPENPPISSTSRHFKAAIWQSYCQPKSSLKSPSFIFNLKFTRWLRHQYSAQFLVEVI